MRPALAELEVLVRPDGQTPDRLAVAPDDGDGFRRRAGGRHQGIGRLAGVDLEQRDCHAWLTGQRAERAGIDVEFASLVRRCARGNQRGWKGKDQVAPVHSEPPVDESDNG